MTGHQDPALFGKSSCVHRKQQILVQKFMKREIRTFKNESMTASFDDFLLGNHLLYINSSSLWFSLKKTVDDMVSD